MYWIGSNGMEMFGRDHLNDGETIEWMYDSKGNKAEGAKILKRFEDDRKGHVVLDYQANPFFENKDMATPEYHTNIRDFWVLSHQGRNVLVAEAEDPVGPIRTLTSIISNLTTFWKGNIGRTPSTYYLMDGTKLDSVNALKKYLEVPKDAQMVNVNDFEDVIVTSSNPRDSQRLKVVRPIGTPEPDKLIEQIRDVTGIGSSEELGQATKALPSVMGTPSDDLVEPTTEIVLPGEVGDASAEVQPVEDSPSETSSLADMLSEGFVDEPAAEETQGEQSTERQKTDSGLNWLDNAADEGKE